MKYSLSLAAILILSLASCRKDDDAGPGGGGGGGGKTCRVASVRTRGGTEVVSYNADGTVRGSGTPAYSYFNGGSIAEIVGTRDTVIRDNDGRLAALYLSWDIGKRQQRRYEYDAQNRVIRTHTNTFNGLDYLVDLTWTSSDVTKYVFNIAGQTNYTDGFEFTYYDTLVPDAYTRMNYISQVGTVMSAHLLKRSIYSQDTTFYSYKLDSAGRIRERYRNWDNSDWVYKRAVDTSYYEYECY